MFLYGVSMYVSQISIVRKCGKMYSVKCTGKDIAQIKVCLLKEGVGEKRMDPTWCGWPRTSQHGVHVSLGHYGQCAHPSPMKSRAHPGLRDQVHPGLVQR